VKREEKILLLAFIAALICGLGIALTFGFRERSLRIQFNTAEFTSTGSLVIDYSYNTPSGTFMVESDTIDGKEMGGGANGGTSLLGIGIPGHGSSQEEFYTNDLPHPVPSLMVQTGKTYVVNLNERLLLYDFTNNRGNHYHSEFRLKPGR
jgi:hypothetical protein